MSGAIGLAALVVVFGIFMPDVLRALSVFLLTLFGRATAFLNAIPSSYPVTVPATGH